MSRDEFTCLILEMLDFSVQKYFTNKFKRQKITFYFHLSFLHFIENSRINVCFIYHQFVRIWVFLLFDIFFLFLIRILRFIFCFHRDILYNVLIYIIFLNLFSIKLFKNINYLLFIFWVLLMREICRDGFETNTQIFSLFNQSNIYIIEKS